MFIIGKRIAFFIKDIQAAGSSYPQKTFVILEYSRCDGRGQKAAAGLVNLGFISVIPDDPVGTAHPEKPVSVLDHGIVICACIYRMLEFHLVHGVDRRPKKPYQSEAPGKIFYERVQQ